MVALCGGGLFAIASTFDKNKRDAQSFFTISMLLFLMSVVGLLIIAIKDIVGWF
jgi:competence protein ComGC